MPPLDTWSFLGKLAKRTLLGDPLDILDDIRESQEEEKKKKTGVIETTAEEVKEKP